MINLIDIEAARDRIAPFLRQTPVIALDHGRAGMPPAIAKLECLQVAGSFKARGAMNRLLTLPQGQAARGIVAASGGNHGIAVSRSAHVAGQRARIYVPDAVSPAKAAAMRGWGAEVILSGAGFDQADAAARADAERTGASYFHPFADAAVIAGQGTLALDLLEQAEFDTVLIAIGGGGLLGGMATALKARRPGIRILGVEPEGAALFHDSLRAGHALRLARITTVVPTLASLQTTPELWQIARSALEDVLLVGDAEIRAACALLWRDHAIAADLAGAASTAALIRHADRLAGAGRIALLVCGAGSEGGG
ncbi:MAG: threonine/serine dehydratase [Paracoccus sp. (in: a-proteobacteria)]